MCCSPSSSPRNMAIAIISPRIWLVDMAFWMLTTDWLTSIYENKPANGLAESEITWETAIHPFGVLLLTWRCATSFHAG
ncbi:unnamed protein product, partial [Clonostachys rhizophaga]